jgi:hypothetical protein
LVSDSVTPSLDGLSRLLFEPIPDAVTSSSSQREQPLTDTHGRGREGDEVEDYNYNMANPRRHSNSGSHGHHIRDFKTKFETVEPEPVFEEELHGASALETGEALENVSTSSTDASVNEDDHPKKA